ncbi:MAG: S1 family peptidase [Defluviitaleaceae bacterium]|nr:S1 family peptidase [Defluviitaleaceae bacterium]MCL2273806.1 S1 family peptidase [Defluviitaleaceae bacterium]
MKKKLYLFYLLFITMLIVNTTLYVNANNNFDEFNDITFSMLAHEINEKFVSEFGHEFVQNHNRAVENAMLLRHSFIQNRQGQVMYPDYFGGMYIDESGNLVILILNMYERSMNVETFNYSLSEIIIMPASFSYNELNALWRFLGTQTIENASSWHVDTISNRVIVRLDYYNEENIDIFINNIIDSPMIVFEQFINKEYYYECFHYDRLIQSKEIYDNSAHLIEPLNTFITFQSGGQIMVRGRLYSIGYAATDANGRSGFVTVAHGPQHSERLQPGDNVYIRHANAWQRIGIVRQSRLQRTVDNSIVSPFRFNAAFVEIVPPHGFTVNFVPNQLLSGVRDPIVGEIVTIRGTNESGTLLTRQQRVTALNVTRTDLVPFVSIDATSTTPVVTGQNLVSGMSGGIVWFNSDLRNAGIIVSSCGLFCRAQLINNGVVGFNLTTP